MIITDGLFQGMRILISAHSDKDADSIFIHCHTIIPTLLTFSGSFDVTGKGTVIVIAK